MAFGSKLLIRHGFTRNVTDSIYSKKFSEASKLSEDKKDEAYDSIFNEIKQKHGNDYEDILQEHAAHDIVEMGKDQMVPTFYPVPLQRHHVIYESPKEGIEPVYFWCLNHFIDSLGAVDITKITDIFAAAEHSSFFGAGAQRLGLAQDKVVQFLATIGQMIKQLFQMVRELRWIDERLQLYDESIKKKIKSADRTLKGLWVDLVDGVIGGQRTGSNLFIMAQQLQFNSLPNLFFGIEVNDTKNIDKIVDTKAKGFNLVVRGTLKAKLQQYLHWRKSTYDELQVRRKFTIDYLAQHFNIIRMYMTWAKPYLRRIQNLSTDARHMNNPSIIKSFETSRVEIEILAKKAVRVKKIGPKLKYAVILMNFEFSTRPSMSFSQEGGYHRGPMHAGTNTIFWRSYSWSQEEINKYIKMKQEEDLELMRVVDRSLADAMDALGKDLKYYLEQVKGQHYPKKEEKKEVQRIKQAGVFEPFEHIFTALAEPISALFKGAINGYRAFLPSKDSKKSNKAIGQKSAEGMAVAIMFLHYKNFKKSHRMLSF